MFPTELSEKIASLDIDHPCFAITMDFLVDVEKGTMERIGISQTYICIHRNFDYDSKSLLCYVPYKSLLHVTQQLNPNIREDSHTLVAFWMVKMNMEMAIELQRMQTGVFRIAQSLNLNPNPSFISQNRNTIKEKNENIFYYIWENAISGKYVEYSSETNYYHEILNVPIYTHFTSPIRRMVDVYNQIIWIYNIHQEKGHLLQTDTVLFDKYSIFDFLVKCNKDTKTIRKIQNECKLLHLLQDKIIHSEESFLVCEGVVIQIELLPLFEKQRITVYFPEYKCMISCKNDCKTQYIYQQKIHCKLFLFDKKDEFLNKIKISLKY
jgi:exoribonuclease R